MTIHPATRQWGAGITSVAGLRVNCNNPMKGNFKISIKIINIQHFELEILPLGIYSTVIFMNIKNGIDRVIYENIGYKGK